MEIEAKYVISDPAVFDALLELRALGEYRLRPAGERSLTDHYLDTAGRDLLRAGYACRLREGEADGRWLLTVKSMGRATGAVHEREEHECDVAPGTTLAEWPEGPARDLVARLSQGHPLTELLTLRQQRANRAVTHAERAVGVLSLDTVEADVAGRHMAAREVEVELGTAGRADDLIAIEAALGPYELRAEPTSKFERALALLDRGPRRSAARKKKVPATRPDEPMAEAGRAILRFHFERMLAEEEGTRKGEDPEALHRMRVATRRQRAALRIVARHFRKKAVRDFRDELRTLAERLGAVRDLDVLIERFQAYRSALGAETAHALEPLLDDWRRRRDVARHEMLHHLDGDAYQSFTTRYAEFLESPGAGVKEAHDDAPQPRLVRDVLPSEIWEHYGRLHAYAGVVEWAPIETVHALRIEGKRLRYLLEFFSEALGPGLGKVIEALVALQDHIGELHDVDVTIGLLQDFLMHDARASVSPAVAQAVGRYLKREQTRLRTLQRTLKRPWARVAGPWVRRALGRTVASL